MDDFQFLIYRSAEEGATVKAVIKDDTIWLTISQMALLFDKEESNLRRHIKNIFDDGELSAENSVQKMHVDGVKQPVAFYNLDVIISVGYRVNSRRATHFRIWATGILKEYMTKGFVLDDERLKQGKDAFGKDYFRELLERVRSIRASERRIWQQVTDIFAECCIDYDRNSPTTKEFYAMVQNKFHYAITGQTAAEIVYSKADHTKEHMGLTTWADAPDGKIKKSDVTIAKNYLSQDEMKQLNRMVTAYLDFAENMTLRHIPLTMEDWEKRLNSFIEMFDYGILQDAGKVSAEIAKLHAETEFEKYRVIQDRLFMSDFDKYMLELEENAKK